MTLLLVLMTWISKFLYFCSTVLVLAPLLTHFLSRDGQPLSIDHDRVQELTSISSRARGLRERLISQVDTGRSSRAVSISHELVFLNLLRIIQISTTKASWFPANPKFYIFLVILQLSLTWLVYRYAIFIYFHFSLLSKRLLLAYLSNGHKNSG